MIRRPTEVSPELVEMVESGKRIVFHFSPNTKVTVVTTDPVEAQWLLQACQPVWDEETVNHMLGESFWILSQAYEEAPVETMEALKQLIQMMEEHEQDERTRTTND